MYKFLVVTLLAIRAFAQTGVADGSIRGVIRDPSGSTVAGGAVLARNMETGFERSASSNDQGEFELPLLPAGPYEVSVTVKGFAPHKQSGVVVRLARASDLAIALQIAATEQTVTVESDASIL